MRAQRFTAFGLGICEGVESFFFSVTRCVTCDTSDRGVGTPLSHGEFFSYKKKQFFFFFLSYPLSKRGEEHVTCHTTVTRLF